MKPINLTLLKALFGKTAGRVRYLLGAKAPHVMCDSHAINQIDCSGFVRWMVARCTNGEVELPDGSQAQLEWAEKNLRQLNQYSDVRYAKEDPKRLFIAFLSPRLGEEWPRHVWLVYMGRTMESHGGAGVDPRAWNTPALRNCKACYELPAE